MAAWQSEVSLCTFEFICMLIGEKLQPFSTSSVLTSSFFIFYIWKKYLRTLVESGLLLYLCELMRVKTQRNPKWHPKRALTKLKMKPQRNAKWHLKETLKKPYMKETLFQDTCWTIVLQLYLLESCFTMVAWQSEVSLCTFEFIRMLIGEKLQPFSTSSVLTSSFFIFYIWKKYLRTLVESGLLLYLCELMCVKP